MSKIENTSNQKDIYSVWKDGIDIFYSNIEKSIPQFHQATTNLFQEYVKSLNNVATSTLDIQREFVTKAGIKSNLPESSISIIHDSAEKMNRSLNVQNKMSIASIDATKQNIKTWNENSSAFANINKSMVDSLISPFNPKI
ncbi:MAG TPA: hypothetical protein VMW55_06580 [Nitrosopumilaceae archaeon]|nr:hypothetical protein [Nitrosopumilaceae archaeon]